jgi:predicted small secreted protein
MKNTSKWFGLIALVAVIALTFAACNKPTGGGDDPKVIAPEWRKTFSSGDYMPNNDDYYAPTTTTLGENTITISGGGLGSPVTITGVYTQGGGPITINDPGEWAFVYKDGVKIGYILGSYNFTNYLLHIGKVAVVNLSANESTFGVTIDLDGVPDYPSIQGIP